MRQRDLHDALGCQPRRNQYDRQASARVRASPHKVQIAVVAMSILRAKVTDLHEIVAQTKTRAFRKVVHGQPVARGIGHLEFQMARQVLYAHLPKAVQDG